MKKKVLHLISAIGLFGAESMMLSLCKELKNSELEVHVGIIGNREGTHKTTLQMALELKLNTVEFSCPGRFSFSTIRNINKFIRENKIDILHSHNYKSNFLSCLSSYKLPVKKVSTCHNWLRENIKMRIYEEIDKFLLKSFDKIAVVSHDLEIFLLQEGFCREKIKFVPNGIDISRFNDPQNRLQGIRADLNSNFVIGTIGRLTPEKGHKYLLQAFSRIIAFFPNAHLILVGDGPLKEQLIKQAELLGIKDRVSFLGVRRDIPQILKEINVFVLPSLKEAMPIAMLEAMATKKPVIASNLGEIKYILENEYSGLLVAPGDVESLIRAMQRLLTNKKFCEKLALNGFEKVTSAFSSKRMLADYLEFYSQLYNKEK